MFLKKKKKRINKDNEIEKKMMGGDARVTTSEAVEESPSSYN